MAMRITAKVLGILVLLDFCGVIPYGEAGFIRVNKREFVDQDCNVFLFSGYNTFQIVDAAVNACCGGRNAVDAQLNLAKHYNLTVVRMFAFPVLDGFKLQVGPNVYNETAFRGLDYVIAAAGLRGLKLIIALSNNWMYNPRNSDTKCVYTNWTTTSYDCDDFFTNPQAIRLFNGNSRAIVNRVNTYNNVTYKDDPTILAWNLMNEPRCERANCHQDVQYWIEHVAPVLKALDPNHLVTVGEDGFYHSPNCQSNYANPVDDSHGGPGMGWPLHTGQDFVPNHALPSIDFLSVHLWPDNWDRTDLDFAKSWLTAHMLNTQHLGKPLVVEEFGKAASTGVQGPGNQWASQTLEMRDAYYKLVYAIVERSLLEDTGLKGILFWRWDAINVAGQILGDFDSASSIRTNSTTFRDVIQPFSYRTSVQNTWNKKRVQDCTPISGQVQAASVGAGKGRRLAQTAVGIDLTSADQSEPARPLPFQPGSAVLQNINNMQAGMSSDNPAQFVPLTANPTFGAGPRPPATVDPGKMATVDVGTAAGVYANIAGAGAGTPTPNGQATTAPPAINYANILAGTATPVAQSTPVPPVEAGVGEGVALPAEGLVGEMGAEPVPQSGDGTSAAGADAAGQPLGAIPTPKAVDAAGINTASDLRTPTPDQLQADVTGANPAGAAETPNDVAPGQALGGESLWTSNTQGAGTSEALPQQLPGWMSSTLPWTTATATWPGGGAQPGGAFPWRGREAQPPPAGVAPTTPSGPAAGPPAPQARPRPPGPAPAVVTQVAMAQLNANITCRSQDYPTATGRPALGR